MKVSKTLFYTLERIHSLAELRVAAFEGFGLGDSVFERYGEARTSRDHQIPEESIRVRNRASFTTLI